MHEIAWAQLICLLTPGLLAGLVWVVAAIFNPGQKRVLIRFDLLTLLLLVTGVSVVLALSRAAESPTDEIFTYLLSIFVLPTVWLIQVVADGLRDARRKREEFQARLMEVSKSLAETSPPQPLTPEYRGEGEKAKSPDPLTSDP